MKISPLFLQIIFLLLALGGTALMFKNAFKGISSAGGLAGGLLGGVLGDGKGEDGDTANTPIEGNTTNPYNVAGVDQSVIDSLVTRLNDSITSWNPAWSKAKRSEVFFTMVHEVHDSVFIAVCNLYKHKHNTSLRESVLTVWLPVHPPSGKGTNAWELLEVTIIERMDKLNIP